MNKLSVKSDTLNQLEEATARLGDSELEMFLLCAEIILAAEYMGERLTNSQTSELAAAWQGETCPPAWGMKYIEAAKVIDRAINSASKEAEPID